MIKAVIFDLDNTLYDYDDCNRYAENALYKRISELFGINESDARTRLYEAKRIVKKRLGNTAASHNRLLYMQTLCELEDVNPAMYAKDLYDCYWNEILKRMVPFSYVKPLFDKLKKEGIKIAVLTDLTAHIQYRKLEKIELRQYIDVLVTSEEAGEEKPSERMFDLVLSKLDVNPEEVLMIGDSQEKDIDGAGKLKIPGILYRKGNGITYEEIRLLG